MHACQALMADLGVAGLFVHDQVEGPQWAIGCQLILYLHSHMHTQVTQANQPDTSATQTINAG